MELTSFATRLREFRMSKGITQKDFAAKIGISAATLSAYESGAKMPSLQTAEKIAREFNMSLDWLCGINETQNDKIEEKGAFLKLLKKILDLGFFEIRIETTPISDYIFGGSTSIENAVLQLVKNPFVEDDYPAWIDQFFFDYKKMNELLITNTLTQEIYDMWIESVIKKYENQPI